MIRGPEAASACIMKWSTSSWMLDSLAWCNGRALSMILQVLRLHEEIAMISIDSTASSTLLWRLYHWRQLNSLTSRALRKSNRIALVRIIL